MKSLRNKKGKGFGIFMIFCTVSEHFVLGGLACIQRLSLGGHCNHPLSISSAFNIFIFLCNFIQKKVREERGGGDVIVATAIDDA